MEESFAPENPPLHPVRTSINNALTRVVARFSAVHQDGIKDGRPSSAPEKLGHALLLQVLSSVRSQRQFVSQIHCDLLFCWFVADGMHEFRTNP